MANKCNILIAAHRHLFYDPGGGEKSMQIIAMHLHGLGHNVTAWVKHCRPENLQGIQFTNLPVENMIPQFDVVLTWGRPGDQVAKICVKYNVPYILSVRWFRNICDTDSIGDLSTKEPDRQFILKHKHIFENASAVITNNRYSADVIERFYHVPALVSFVPVLGKPNPVADPNGYVLAVSPDKGLDEINWILRISAQLPQEERIMVVNAKPDQFRGRANIHPVPHRPDMSVIWRQCKMMIQPIYENDICGTLRTTIEAMQHGLPVIANRRCGMWEKVPENNLVSYNADVFEWRNKIKEVGENWGVRSREALQVFREYDTPGQLKVFEREIERAAKVKNYNP